MKCFMGSSEIKCLFSALKNFGIVEISSVIDHEVSSAVFLLVKIYCLRGSVSSGRQAVDTTRHNLALKLLQVFFV